MDKKNYKSYARSESRICFGLVWFTEENDAVKYGTEVRYRGDTYNGGWNDGMSCGRDSRFDYVEDGIKYFAVSEA